MEPYTTLAPYGSDNPVDLWNWLQNYEEKTGGQILAIAHNGNLSNGIMFPMEDSFTGKRVTKDYVETRARWEPLYETTQIKGDGETHPFLSPNDEFADYETWDQGNLDLSALKEDDMLEFEYARSALGVGMQLEERYGTNPYKFGQIGSTDTHTGLATAEEENFFGKHSGAEPNPKFRITSVKTRLYRGLCRNNDLLHGTFDLFHDNRDNIYALIAGLEGLTNSSRKKLTGYVDDFYEELANEAQVNRKFLTRCSEATAPQPNPT